MFHGYTFQYPEDTLIKRFVILIFVNIIKEIILCVLLLNASADGTCSSEN